jgi:hypothetical protein
MAALDVPGWLVSGSSNVLRTRIQRLRIIQQSSDCLLQYWQVLLDNSPNYDLVERGVSVDQNISESNDLTAIGNFGRDVRCNLREAG